MLLVALWPFRYSSSLGPYVPWLLQMSWSQLRFEVSPRGESCWELLMLWSVGRFQQMLVGFTICPPLALSPALRLVACIPFSIFRQHPRCPDAILMPPSCPPHALLLLLILIMLLILVILLFTVLIVLIFTMMVIGIHRDILHCHPHGQSHIYMQLITMTHRSWKCYHPHVNQNIKIFNMNLQDIFLTIIFTYQIYWGLLSSIQVNDREFWTLLKCLPKLPGWASQLAGQEKVMQ